MVDVDKKDIEIIKKQLVIKTINKKKYYYYKTKFGVESPYLKRSKHQTTYVCPVNYNDEQIRACFCHAKMKLFGEMLKFFYETTLKNYKIKLITKKKIQLLEFLRFAYSTLLRGINKPDMEKYEDAVYTKYVYGTTSIEGNTYTLRETDLTLNEGLTIGGKEAREFHEIENYAKWKEFIQKQKNVKFDIPFIKKIHSIILDNIDNNAAGSFRMINVGIRGSDFVPTPGILVETEMEKLMKWLNTHYGRMYPIELASIFHQKFEEIHPFLDGNGRVGREILRLMLKDEGFPTIFVSNQNREDYLKSLDKGNKRDFRPLTRFIIKNLLEVHTELIEKSRSEMRKNEEGAKKCKECRKFKACAKLAIKYTKFIPKAKSSKSQRKKVNHIKK